MEHLTEPEKVVLEIIKKHNAGNKIFDGQIREQILIADPAEKPGAGLRRVINALRCKGYAICSDTRGYWYASTKQELVDNIEALKGRAIKILEAAKGMEHAIPVFDERRRTLFDYQEDANIQ